MSLKSIIPARDQFWRNMFARSLSVAAEDGQILLEVEWPNGQLTFEPAIIDEESNQYVCENGMTFYSRGKGSDPKRLAGIPVIHVYAENAGAVSTYHALMSTAMTDDIAVPVDEQGRELVNEDGNPTEYAEVATDGGEIVNAADYVARIPDDHHGMEFSLKESSYHDPEPVSQEDAKRAVEQAQVAEKDPGDIIRYIAYGVAFGLVPILLIVILIWLLGQLGGGGGGSGVNIGLSLMGGALP